MVSRTKLVTGAAAVVTAGSLAFAGATLASADTPTDASGSASTSRQNGTDQGDQSDQGGRGFGGRGGHEHTAVTGDEKTKVTAAVTAKDSGVKVEEVRKDADGSYDVMGTKDGSRVMVEVSKDLKTVEVRTGGPGGHGGRGGDHGGPGGHEHTAVTGDEKTKVTAAVTAKDSGVKVEEVRKDADGSYDVMGTKDGSRVMVEVSSDLKTVEVRTGGPGGHGGPGGRDGAGGQDAPGAPAAPGADGQAPTQSGSTGPATVPSTGTGPTDIPSTQAA